MPVVINGDTGISPVTASGTSASVDGMTVGRGGGEVANNTAVGAGAMAATSTGDYNTAVGASSLAANTSGTQNTGIGRATLFTNTSGGYNFAGGLNSMYYNTSGASNTAIGVESMQANTTGGSNVAVGRQALISNTTASNNVAVGYQAGLNNTTGRVHTFLGSEAGKSNTTGVDNVAVGNVALFANTTGNYNVALGGSITGTTFGALGANTTGSSNTAVGVAALVANTTGGNNTAIGYNAGSANTTNSNNTYIGYTCGSSHTGAGCIFIGPNAFSGYNGSNQVVFKTGDGREALYADIGGGGSFRQYSNSATWAVVSDQRVKENIVEITNGLEKIVALRPVTFDYITSKEHNAGFIAQDFQTVLPDQVKLVKARPEEAELVGEDEIYSIQQNLTPYLVKAIQELKAEFDAYKATHP
jgi:hypothetical protein